MDLNQEYRYDVDSRLRWVVWIIAAFFTIVMLRLLYLQLIKGEYYGIFSENNTIKEIELPAWRGVVYDRHGEIVADNRAVFDLVVVPQYVTNKDELISTLTGFLGLDRAKMEGGLGKAFKSPPYRPFILAEDVGMDVVARLKARRLPFPAEKDYNIDGLDIRYRYVRSYPSGESVSHLLGYIREVDSKGLERLAKKYPGRYRMGDQIGVDGIEEVYDIFIRGKDGLRQKIVDALGREVNYPDISLELVERPTVGGGNMYLTVDLSLQEAARKALAGRSGAVVAIEPASGAILAIYSSPSYDLNRLYTSGRNSYWSELTADPAKPLFNRAVHGTYPPASTYKIVTATAALEEGVIDKGGLVTCHGGMRFGDRFFGCWLEGGHGSVGIIDALARSCDVFFYNMGLRLGIDRLAQYAREFGLGRETGIELPGEKAGLVPTEEWKLKNRGERWRKSETLSIAIGQGYNLVTPVQMALVAAEVANGGYRVVPHVVMKIMAPDGDALLYEWSGRAERLGGISDKTFEIIREGLVNVVEGEEGTARRLKTLGLNIAGKTGTAQVVGRDSVRGGRKPEPHAWFVGFAPSDRPEIAVAAIVEHGGHGASAAAPIVGEVIGAHLKGKTLY